MEFTTNQTIIEIQPQPTITIELVTNPVEIKGDTGDTGLSAYELAVQEGFVGTLEQWLDSFQNRVNHTGTQPISSIENLQTTLNSKQPTGDYATNTALTQGLATKENADSTILKEADIGVIVQPYNANLVTYTQTEKDKLATIEEGAEVNVQSDWNSTSGNSFIQNKPVLGSIASRDSNEFATAEQGNKADSAVQVNQISNFETTTQLNARDTANRDRDNHTGTQTISTISGLQTALDSKQPTGDYITNTALNNGLATKEPVIITGTAGEYWRGDKTWQTLNSASVGLGNVNNTNDLSKPISTATQTALDLKANLASPTFTGNLTLPNNTRINGIEHFYQATKPTVRRDGSALVIGDRWWKTDTGGEWFWNGTYWLSSPFYFSTYDNYTPNVPALHIPPNPDNNVIFIHYAKLFTNITQPNPLNDYINFVYFGFEKGTGSTGGNNIINSSINKNSGKITLSVTNLFLDYGYGENNSHTLVFTYLTVGSATVNANYQTIDAKISYVI